MIEKQPISNDELVATNEELQSTVEELETFKEELQSVNEEPVTLNAELQANIDQPGDTQSDLRNLLDDVSGGIIFLDEQLRIRRLTPAAAGLYRLIASDVGRQLADIVDDELLVAAQSASQAARRFGGKHRRCGPRTLAGN